MEEEIRRSKATSRLSRSNKRQDSLFPEIATREDKKMALRQDIIDYPAQEVGSIGHIVRMLAQFGLPHSDPLLAENEAYERTNGDLSFRINSNIAGGKIPWGIYPRLLLACISTQACLHRSRVIHMGTNVSSMLRDELGMSITGGENGTITHLKDQAYRLFTSTISISKRRSNLDIATIPEWKKKYIRNQFVGQMVIAKGVWEDKTPDDVWESTIVLSEDFYQETILSAVPIDWRIVRGIRSSPLALDLYFWLTHRMNHIRHKTPIPMFGENSIFQQLGSGYQDTKSSRYTFKKRLASKIESIRQLWPDLKFEFSPDDDFLILKPSKPSVSKLA